LPLVFDLVLRGVRSGFHAPVFSAAKDSMIRDLLEFLCFAVVLFQNH
jgi:hypothetical protein